RRSPCRGAGGGRCVPAELALAPAVGGRERERRSATLGKASFLVKEASPPWIQLIHYSRIIGFEPMALRSGSCARFRMRAFAIASYGRKRCALRRASASTSPR